MGLYNLDDQILEQGELDVALRYGESQKLTTLDFADAIAQHDRRQLYLRLWLDAGGQTVSQQTVFFTAPRFLNLRRAPVQYTIRPQNDGAFEIEFSSPAFQHSVEFDLAGTDYRASDNFFDLYPDVPHRVQVRAGNMTEAQLAERLTTRSLVDSY